jgi:Fic family protein
MIFTPPELVDPEVAALDEIGKIRAAIKYSLHAPARWFGVLRRSSFARAIQGSNSIEGYNVSAEDALAAVEGEAPLDAKDETWLAVKGYRDAMTYVLQLATDPHFSYSEGLIKSLHFMMTQHELMKRPGAWRPGAIFVRDEQKGAIVYEGPDAAAVPGLIGELMESLNSNSASAPMVRAAMAHLNLVMIHPFSDGNGRMSRCLQTLVLAREGILEPEFCSIEEYLGRNTQDYYDVLALVGKGAWNPQLDARPWLRFCLTAHYRQAKTIVRRIEEVKRVWDEAEILIQKHRLHERCIYALADATMGFKIRNSTYRSIAEITENLASRDLKAMVDLKLIVPDGQKRGRVYAAAPILQEIRERTRLPKTTEDPFATSLGS